MATSPPGFTSNYQPKHISAYRQIPPLAIPVSKRERAGELARSDFLKARVSLARIEGDILDWHPNIDRLSPETVAKSAPEFLQEYLAALKRFADMRTAYEAAAPEDPEFTTGALAPTPPTQSTVFKGLVAGRKRTTRKPRKTRKHGPSRVLRRTRGRVSRRTPKA
jgi:hypothetical protein